jgi:malate dehydrogenase (oxaloacetate-decarboxylating)
MIPFKIGHEKQTGQDILETQLSGHLLLETPLLNKGSAFTLDERREFGLHGLLPSHIAAMEEQLARTYENYRRQESDLERYIYLADLQDRNETLFYRLLHDHIAEMLPVIYTPSVGAACQRYSHIYHRPRGLYIAYPDREEIDTILGNTPSSQVDVIVVTDGERILGLGDQGIGGMGIPIGKLALYTLCAGIHPATTLPIVLDVGTDNPDLLNDPLYLGWRHERVRGPAYDDFVEAFVQGVQRRFPNVLLQWEDFSKHNAGRLLERYRDRLCTFNDDIQGTAAVTLAGLLAAMDVIGAKLGEQRIVLLGAGSAAIGISDQLVAAMISEGRSEREARSAIWLVDSRGLVHTGRADLESSKQRYAQPLERVADWPLLEPEHATFADVVRLVRPTILIGVAAQAGAFTEELIRELARHVERPIIFPLSNPTSKSEATPADLLAWTAGRALIATGSPFAPATVEGRSIRIGQCNNAFIFPGVGLGVIAAGARRVSDAMFVAAARALSDCSPARRDPQAALYPVVEDIRAISKRVALAVAAEAQRAGLAEPTSAEELERRVAAMMWVPQYALLKHVPDTD